ncbi:MAG: 3-isopropylmalate dehydrogenase [Chloroflexi bacterium]|nr:3-isopropylmalate dehydrogenase [Chloroflexota bacterium]
MRKFDIAIIPGDGIGREIVPAAAGVLEEVARRYNHLFNLHWGLLGGAAMDKGLPPLPQETLDMVRKCDAILFGSVGDPKYDFPGAKILPNEGLRGLRAGLKLYTNLRPAKYIPTLANRTPFKPSTIRGVDLVIVRDFAGSFARGRSKVWKNAEGRQAQDFLVYSEKEIRRSLTFAFKLAQTRRKKLTLAAQAGVFATSRLWREIAREMLPDYPDVEFETYAPDNCAMQLERNPASFDVIVNDIVPVAGMLNNQAAMLMGSLGMAPSAALRPESAKGLTRGGALFWGFGLYEPIHGSSPKHAGKDEVNPIATILSAALLLRHSLGLDKEAAAVERAINKVLRTHRTYDLMETGKTKVGTKQMGELIAAALP